MESKGISWMNDTHFLNFFLFNDFSFNGAQYRDNRHGIERHFFAFMKAGRGRIVTEHETLELNTGDMFYIPKGLKYQSYWIPEGTVRFDSIGFLYFPTPSDGYCLQKIPFDEELWQAFAPLSQSKERNLTSIGQLCRFMGLVEARLRPAAHSRAEEVVNQLLVHIQEDHTRTVTEYAAACRISESQLYNYVRQVLGKTPNRLRQEVACQKAIDLLCSTDLTVEHICDRVGFSSASYFRKVLAAVHGKTPGAIRRESKTI